MKIRNGFVSNSSSSSFIIYGYDISRLSSNNLIEELRRIFPNIEENIKDTTEEEIEFICETIGLDYISSDGEYPMYIGINIGDPDKGITLNKLKESLKRKNALEKLKDGLIDIKDEAKIYAGEVDY